MQALRNTWVIWLRSLLNRHPEGAREIGSDCQNDEEQDCPPVGGDEPRGTFPPFWIHMFLLFNDV